MGTKATSDFFYTLYYFSMHATSGGLGAAIAGTGSLIQALTPDKWMKKTKYYRIGGAIILACLAIAVSFHTVTNMLPLLAVIGARFFELSSSPQKIRCGLLLTFPPWIIYNLSHELYLIVGANLIVFASLGWAIYKHRNIKVPVEPI